MEQFQYYQKQAYVTLSRCARHAGAEVEMRYGSWNTTVQQLEGGMSSGDSEPLVDSEPSGGSESFGDSEPSESFGDSEPSGGSESFGDSEPFGGSESFGDSEPFGVSDEL